MDLIEGAGYPAETHHVITEDGYILAVHRSHNSILLKNSHLQNTSARESSSVIPPWLPVLVCRDRPHEPQPQFPHGRPGLRRLAHQLQRQRLLQEPHCEPQCPISFSLLTQITSTAPSGTSPGGRWGQWFVAAPEKTSLLDFFPRTCPL